MTKNLISIPILPFLPKKIFREFYLLQQIEIVPSYHPIQFNRKLINQTFENSKKPNFGYDFGPYGANLSPQIFARGFYPYWVLDIVARYHRMRNYDPSSRKWRKNLFWARFKLVGPKFAPSIFFSKYLASLVTRFHGQLSSCTISESLLLLIYLWLAIKIQLKVYLWVQMQP